MDAARDDRADCDRWNRTADSALTSGGDECATDVYEYCLQDAGPGTSGHKGADCFRRAALGRTSVSSTEAQAVSGAIAYPFQFACDYRSAERSANGFIRKR